MSATRRHAGCPRRAAGAVQAVPRGWRRIVAVVAAASLAWLHGADGAHADGVTIDSVAVAARDATTATVTFDITWSHSWRHGTFHDAVWVFFKAQAAPDGEWRPVRLVADRVVNPTGWGQDRSATPLEFVVPDGEDGLVGVFVRRAADGVGTVGPVRVTAVCDLGPRPRPDADVRLRAYGIEMVYVAEGPFFLGSGGAELNRFHRFSDPGGNPEDADADPPPTPPYHVAAAGPIPTGRQMGRLWATGMAPMDGGEIPAAFPTGYAGFYCMRQAHIPQALYAGFLETLTAPHQEERWHARGHGQVITRTDAKPSRTYAAADPRGRVPWLSWADCTAFAAWAGLRPMTELEFEKAVRGPLDPEPGEAGLSYWGLGDVNAGDVYERFVSAGVGLGFKGSHGRGLATPPPDWPSASDGVAYRGHYLKKRRYSFVGHLRTSGRSLANSVTADRSADTRDSFGGWRAARTAPRGDAGVAPVVAWPALATLRPLALRKPIAVDGGLDDWREAQATLDGAESVFPVARRFFVPPHCADPWRGSDDTSAHLHLGTDGDSLCVAVSVRDDRQVDASGPGGIQAADAVRIAVVNAAGGHWTMILARTAGGAAFQIEPPAGAIERAVVRDDAAARTRYELRVPRAALGLHSGEAFGFNCWVLDADGADGVRHWLQLGPGTADPAQPDRYPRFDPNP